MLNFQVKRWQRHCLFEGCQEGRKAYPATAFGDYPGTGICIKKHYLYASSNEDVYRYQLDKNGEVINPDSLKKLLPDWSTITG